MRTEINERLRRRQHRIATYLVFLNFAVLIGSMIVMFLPVMGNRAFDPTSPETQLILSLPALVLPIIFVVAMISVRMTNLWLRQPRPETALHEGLKGLSNKSVLYSYYHFPARHVLICPQGVFAINVKFQEGQFGVEGETWTTAGGALGRLMRWLRREQIGNPNEEARTAAARVAQQLAPIAPEAEVRPLVVFVDPRAEVSITDPAVPVLYADSKRSPNLTDYLRDVPKEARTPLSRDQIEAFEEATLPG